PTFAGMNGEWFNGGADLNSSRSRTPKRRRGPCSPRVTFRSSVDGSEARTARRARASAARAARCGLRLHRQQALALPALAGELAGAADRFRLLPGFLFGGFLVVAAELHLAENPLALHLLLERLEGLIDVIVPDENLHAAYLFGKNSLTWVQAARRPRGHLPPPL